jgi:hypothetical protein
MASDPQDILSTLGRVLKPYFDANKDLADLAKLAGHWLVSLAESKSHTGSADSPAGVDNTSQPNAASPATFSSADSTTSSAKILGRINLSQPPVPRLTEATVPLKLGNLEIPVRVSGTTADIGRARQAAAFEPEVALPRDTSRWARAAELDLGLMSKRLKLKAEACALAASESMDEQQIRERARPLIEQSDELEECRLWMLQDIPKDRAATDRLAKAYANVSAAFELSRVSHEAAEAGAHFDMSEVLQLLAEAQNALRIAHREAGARFDDTDQNQVFTWLRYVTERDRVFVSRFLRADDPADPHAWHELTDRIADKDRVIRGRLGDLKQLKSAFSKVKFHVARIAKAEGTPDPEDWDRVAQACQHLVVSGVTTHDRKLIDLIRPVINLAPDSIDPASPLGEVLEELRGVDEDEDENTPVREYSPRVHRVRDWLKGRRVVLIGGTRIQHQSKRLEEAFELGELSWQALAEHSSSEPLRVDIDRYDTDLVIAIVKLAGHAHIDDARSFAREAGKPFVLIRAGHSPEQIALAVIEQVSDHFESVGGK